MKNNTLADLIFWSFGVGGVVVLTRPGSQGPSLLKNLTGGYAGIVQASTGQAVTA